MSALRRLSIVCAAALLLQPSLSWAQDIKPPIRGLVSMGAYRFVGYGGDPVNTLEPLNAKPGIFGGLVVIASWKQLQPTPDTEIGPNNVIDRALAEVRTYNERNPGKPLAVKLRVWGGFEAPDWAKALGGPPIETIFNEKPRTVGRFWSPAYRQAWAALQQQLAARFDRRPLIAEVAVTSCMSYTAEPFVVPIQEGVLRPLRAAGFTDAAYKECLSHALADYAPWQHSRLVLSVNPLRTGPGQGNGDQDFTEGLMRDCRRTIGRRCVFDNHDLDTELPGPLHRIYATMKQLGPEIEFPDLADDAQGFRRHDQTGRLLRRELDRALPGLWRLSAGSRRQAQAMGGHDRGQQRTLNVTHRVTSRAVPTIGAASAVTASCHCRTVKSVSATCGRANRFR